MLNDTVIRNPDHVMIAVFLTALQRLGGDKEKEINGLSPLDLIVMNPNKFNSDGRTASADSSSVFTNFESPETI